MTKTKQIFEHTDILGQPIQEGNYVAISHRNSMYICQVTKINPKMIRVIPVKNTYRGSDGFLIYSNQSILLSGSDATAYILKYKGS